MAEERAKPVKLFTVATTQEARDISAALEDAGIPSSWLSSGKVPDLSVVTGGSVGEIDIFVPDDREQDAIDILIGMGLLLPDDAEVLPEAEEEVEAEAKETKKSSIGVMILLLLLAALAVLGTDKIMAFLKGLFS